jgi:small subunit ribosomal protein S17e
LDRVRRISEEIVLKFPDLFGTDYQANKEQLNKIAVIHSKMVRNKVAGYITKMNGRAAEEEAEEEEERQQPA